LFGAARRTETSAVDMYRSIAAFETGGKDAGTARTRNRPHLFSFIAQRVHHGIAHFHRAEIARMAGWRDRIDRTTNWAITLVAAMLSSRFRRRMPTTAC